MSLGSLVVSLVANTSAFVADLGRASHEAAKSMEGIKRDAERAGKAMGIALVAAAGTMAVLVKQSINAADSMAKMAQSTGIGIATLSELNYVAMLAGVNTEAMATSVGRLNRNIVDAAAGT